MAARICVCDDDPVMTALLSLELTTAGFTVDEPLHSAPQAIAALVLSQPDILLLDLHMPLGGGLDLLQDLHDRGLLDAMRVLMLTGDDDIYYMDRAKRLGASGYLTKPIGIAPLVARVCRLLSDRRVRWMDDISTLTSPNLHAPVSASVVTASNSATLNPTVAQLSRNYGKGAVDQLLVSLLGHLTAFDSVMPEVPELEAAAHAVKGAAACLGFTTVSEACFSLETACKSGQMLELPLRNAHAACTSARADISGYLAQAA